MSRRPVEAGSPAAAIIAEEREILDRVRRLLARGPSSGGRAAHDYDADLIALRDEVAEAKPEDLAPLVESMTRLQGIIERGRRGEAARAPVDAASPYFAHLRLREAGKTRDVLIGRRGLIDRQAGVQIVDWRDAPVSQIYYRYDEGDDYDEHVAERRLEGIVEARRNLSIVGGVLRRVGCPQGTFFSDASGRWWEADASHVPTLEGGQGKAARPPSRAPAPPKGASKRLGVHEPVRADKHLPEIAALIDRHQFDLITSPGAGLCVIQGGAGSGKTTVALHRVAYLTFHDPKRFRPSRCLVVVPSPALERYVAGVLPALGVRGVAVMTVRGWMRSMRKRVLGPAGDKVSEETPPTVARVKKHPAMLAVLDGIVADLAREAEDGLAGALSGDLLAAWRGSASRPLLPRLAKLARAAQAAHDTRAELSIRRVRRRSGDVRGLWAEALTDGARLRRHLPAAGPRAVSDRDLAETVAWTSAQLDPDAAEDFADVDPELRAPIDGGSLDDSERGRAAGHLDPEDDPLLLRLAERLDGGLLPASGGEPVAYDHVAIDEAQDLSAVEVQVLLDAVTGPGDVAARSVTIAGDVAQRLVLDNGFAGWSELLADVGVREGVPIRPLHLSYRSTAEVMRFARHVLGALVDETDLAARPGAPVALHRFAAMGEAVAFLAEALRSLAGREPTASVALIARHPAQADGWYAALQRAEVGWLRRVRRQDFTFTAGVDVTDVAQVKGLEFDYVVLLDVTAESYPATVEARHLLHIGATRAAHQLWLVSASEPSPLCPEELLREEETT